MQTRAKRTEGKISKDYGMTDYYKYYQTTSKNPVNAIIFNKVISTFNKTIVEKIIEEGLEYTPIMLQMKFCVRKHKGTIKLKNSRLVNTNPVDWKTTMKLWEEDEEAKEKKLVIRYLNNHTSKYIFRIKMIKEGYTYKNKKFYRFKACRFFQRALAKRILDPNKDNFEAFNLY